MPKTSKSTEPTVENKLGDVEIETYDDTEKDEPAKPTENKININNLSADNLFGFALKNKDQLLQLMRLYNTYTDMLEDHEKGLNSFLKHCAELINIIDEGNQKAIDRLRQDYNHLFSFISHKGFNQVENYMKNVFLSLIHNLEHLLNCAFHTKKFTEESLLNGYGAPLAIMMIDIIEIYVKLNCILRDSIYLN
jgi:hypothetical protein